MSKNKEVENAKSKETLELNEVHEIKEALLEIKQALFLLQKDEKSQDSNRVEDTQTNNTSQDTSSSSALQNNSEKDQDIDLDELEDISDDSDIDCTEEELEKALSNLLETKINQITGGK